MAAPSEDVSISSTSEITDFVGKEKGDHSEYTEYDGKSKQDLLDTIKRLQNQLSALQKSKGTSGASSVLNQSSSLSEKVVEITDQSQTVTDGTRYGTDPSCAHTENFRKRTEDGLQKSEGSSSLGAGGLIPQSNKKWRKEKKQRPFDFTRYNKRHVALRIAYLGWDYQGFASQVTTENTIEAHLFDALHKTRLIEDRAKSNYSRCGRTDKGVSAFGQVIALDLRSNLLEGHGVILSSDNKPNERLGEKNVEIDYVKFLNRVLPDDMRVLAWSPVNVGFSARFDCRHRTYKYFFPKGDLDIELMQKAAEKLVGQHDYRNLCKMDVANGVVNFVRKILDIEISPVDDRGGGYQMYVFQVRGQAFLYHQVRCMVAILFMVGQGKEEPEIMDRLLDVEKQPCKPQYTMALDHPLVLYKCAFEGVNWIYDKDELEINMSQLQSKWASYSIRAATLKTMLDDLAKAPIACNTEDNSTEKDKIAPWDSSNPPLLRQSRKLAGGIVTKVHKPLLERPVGDSLEDRIRHYSKKLKLDESAQT